MIRGHGRTALVGAGVLLVVLAAAVGGAQAAPATAGARVAATADPGSVAATRTSHTSVRIAVPAVTVILLNSEGRPIAVETNTNRSPQRGDLFFTTDTTQGQDLAKATPAQTNQVLKAVTATAVWQPGWHSIGRR